jgi:hypothetical protein
MPIGNGGIIGPANVPTITTASGVWSLREQQQAQGRGAWPLALTTDPYFEYTTLLLPGNGTDGANNNTFLDGSTNNFTITRNGNTTQGTFSPFSQTGWGGAFNTSTTYLTVTDTANLRFGSSNFTIEAWVYRNASGATQTIASKGASTPTGWVFQISSADKLVFTDTSTSITGATSIAANTWTYVAVVRAGTSANQTTLYVNGTSDGTGTSATNFNQTSNMLIGADRSTTNFANGYISNLRLSNTNRTISSTPTTALTADANTIFLSLNLNRFQYTDSTAAYTNISVTGTPSVVAFSPFNPTLPWIASINGGSGYFDGNGDSLGAPSNVALAVGTSDFSLDCWIYTNTSSSTPFFIFDTRNADDDQSGFVIYRRATGKLTFAYSVGVTFTAYEGATTLNGNTWYHVAVTRVSNELRLFVNGVLDRSPPTVSTNFSRQTNILVGAAWSSATSNGYISNLRLTKGGIPTLFSTSSTTSGTAIFTPPSTPTTSSDSLTAGSLSLLLNFTNAGIYDATSKNDLETLDNTVNGVRISTAQSQFGGSSIYFDGTGTDYLWIQADQPIQRFGTAPFTIELWIRLAATGSARGLVAKGTSTTGWLVSLNTSNQVVFTYGTSTITSTGTISANNWTYIAVVREGTGANQTKIYIGGVNDGTGTVSTDFTQTSSMYIGADRTGGSLFSGYMQDVRITNGYARTVTTIPTTAFPVI